MIRIEKPKWFDTQHKLAKIDVWPGWYGEKWQKFQRQIIHEWGKIFKNCLWYNFFACLQRTPKIGQMILNTRSIYA